jgi:hypothetical protein
MDLSTGKKHARLISKDDKAGNKKPLASSASSALATVIADEKEELRHLKEGELSVSVTPGGGAVVVPAGSAVVESGDEASSLARNAEEADARSSSPSGLDPASEAIRGILMSLPEPEPELSEAAKNPAIKPEELTALLRKVWERRQEQLKEAFKGAKTEAQQMHGLLQQLLEPSSAMLSDKASTSLSDWEEHRINLLEGLEYHVATLHNAEDFTAMGGIGVMTMLLNDTVGGAEGSSAVSPAVASRAAWVLGTATKYAPKIQKQATDDGTHIVLMRALGAATRALEGLAVGTDVAVAGARFNGFTTSEALEVGAKTVYALGSLARGNHDALVSLSHMGLGRELRNLMKASAAAAQQGGAKGRGLCSKSATLLGDLIRETHERKSKAEGPADDALPSGDGAASVLMTALDAKTKTAMAIDGSADGSTAGKTTAAASRALGFSSFASSHQFVLDHLCGNHHHDEREARDHHKGDASSICHPQSLSGEGDSDARRTAELVEAAVGDALSSVKDVFASACGKSSAAELTA